MALKCPSGHGILEAGERVCPYCSLPGVQADGSSVNENPELSFENLTGKIGNSLKEIKSLKRPSIFSIFSKDNSFQKILAESEGNVKQLKLYYADNRKTQDIISNSGKEIELKKTERSRQLRKSKLMFISVLIFCLLAVVFIFFSPLPESEEYLTENQKIERISLRIDKYLVENKYGEAKTEAEKLGMFKKTEALRRIQIKKTDDEFSVVRNLIDSNQLQEAESKLTQINWEPIENPKFDIEEKQFIKGFLNKKEELSFLISKKK